MDQRTLMSGNLESCTHFQIYAEAKPLDQHIVCFPETSPILSCPSMPSDMAASVSHTHTAETDMLCEVEDFSPPEFPGSQNHRCLCFRLLDTTVLLRHG